jgi:hypothetical protein
MSTIEGALIIAAAVILFSLARPLFKKGSSLANNHLVGDLVSILVSGGIAAGLVLSAIHAESDGLMMDLIALAIVVASFGWLFSRLKGAS